MESKEIIVILMAVFLSALVLFGLPFTTYRLGRTLERRALTKALIKTVEDTHYDGLKDGQKLGYAKGRTAGLQTCDDILTAQDDGRY